MKKIIYLFAFFVFQLTMAQQTKITTVSNENDNNIYNSAGIDVKPEYPGGMSAFYAFIGKNYVVPNVKDLKGRVIVSFVVEKDGSLADIKVLKDIGFGTGEEAIRVLKLCEKWIPASQNGKLVRCSYQLPLSIELAK